jgi:hypothetical protein
MFLMISRYTRDRALRTISDREFEHAAARSQFELAKASYCFFENILRVHTV